MGRMLLARVLVLLGALFLILSLLAGYVRFQGLDTDTVENAVEVLRRQTAREFPGAS